jgi:hypothetical protein
MTNMGTNRAVDSRDPGTRTVAPAKAPQRGLAPGMASLQRAIGNRAMGKLLARRPTNEQLDSERVSADYTDAAALISDWYEDNHAVLELKDGAEAEAIKNFMAFTDLKDPPDMGMAIFVAAFSAIVDLIPGGALLKTGITMGVFAHDMAGLKKELAKDDIELDTSELKTPGAETVEKAEKIHGAFEKGHQIGEGAVKIKEAYDETKEKQAQAAEAAERAHTQAELGIKRLGKFEDALAALQTQRDQSRKWLSDARSAGRHRGGLKALVADHLGPSPKLKDQKESLTKLLAEAMELALYKAKFGDLWYVHNELKWADGAVDVVDSYFSTGERYVHQDHRYVMDQTLTMAVRLRIATLAGNPGWAYDDRKMAEILGMTTTGETTTDPRSKAETEKGTAELQEKYGRRQPGEM